MKKIAQYFDLKTFKIFYMIVIIFLNILLLFTIYSFFTNSFNFFWNELELKNYTKLDLLVQNSQEIWQGLIFWLKNTLLNFVIKIIIINIAIIIFKNLPATNFILKFEKDNELSHNFCRKLSYNMRYTNFISFQEFFHIYKNSLQEINYLNNIHKNPENKDIDIFLKKYDENYLKDIS